MGTNLETMRVQGSGWGMGTGHIPRNTQVHTGKCTQEITAAELGSQRLSVSSPQLPLATSEEEFPNKVLDIFWVSHHVPDHDLP